MEEGPKSQGPKDAAQGTPPSTNRIHYHVNCKITIRRTRTEILLTQPISIAVPLVVSEPLES